MRLSQRGISLLETILIALFLAGLALSIPHYFLQTRTTMRSVSQATLCQSIARQALDNVVSLGARLYGYKINKGLYSKPLFIKNRGAAHTVVNTVQEDSHAVNKACKTSYSGDNNACYLSLHNEYKKIFKRLTGSSTSDNVINAGMPLITNPADSTTKPIEIAPSVMLVNFVNFLQYLYNSNVAYSIGDGKLISLNSPVQGSIPYFLERYKERFNLKKFEFLYKNHSY